MAQPQFTSEVEVTDDRIVGVLRATPWNPLAIEQAVADALEAELIRHGYARAAHGRFERTFPAGRISLAVAATPSGQSVGVAFEVEVTFDEPRRRLRAMTTLEGHYLPGAPTMVSTLQQIAGATQQTRHLAAAHAPGHQLFSASDANAAAQLARDHAVPLLAALTEQSWYEDPRAVIRMVVDLLLAQDQVPAGFEFVCMEDLILAHQHEPERFAALVRKRVDIERRFGAAMPSARRWSTVEGLQKLRTALLESSPAAAATAREIPRDFPDETEDVARADVATRLLKLFVLPALVLKSCAWLALLASWQGEQPIQILSSSLHLAGVALAMVAIFMAAPTVHPQRWLRWLLPLSGLVPYAGMAVLVYLAVRLTGATRTRRFD